MLWRAGQYSNIRTTSLDILFPQESTVFEPSKHQEEIRVKTHKKAAKNKVIQAFTSI